MTKSEYWKNRKAGIRGQGLMPKLSEVFTSSLSIGRRRDRSERFSRAGRHKENAAKNDNLGRRLDEEGRLA